MPKPPDDAGSAEHYDFQKIQNIVSALDFLRTEAGETGVEDIKTIIDSTFKMVLTTYTLVLRYHCTNNLPPEKIQ